MNKKIITLLFLIMFSGHSVFSATATWDLNGNGAWNINGNWTPATFPNAQDDTAILGPVITANRTLSLGQNITIGTLSINDNNNYKIEDAFTLIFDSTTASTITVSSTGDHDIKVPISLLSDLTISQGSTKNFTFFNPISGAQAITKNGAGKLKYQGASPNTYSGLTTINVGELELKMTAGITGIAGNLLIAGGLVKVNDNNQLSGSTNVTVSSGTFDLNKKIETISSLSMSGGSVTLGGDAGASLSLTSVGTALTMGDGASISEVGTVNLTGGSGGGVIYNGTATAATISSTLDLGSAVRTFAISNGTAASDMEISGVVSGLGGITKTGAGTLTLSGINTYTGGTSVDVGTLSISSASNLGSGNLSFNGGTLTPSAVIALTTNITLGGSGTIDTTTGDTTLSGVISEMTTGTLTKTGTGTLTLSGTSANTYSGLTTVSGGTLSLNKTTGNAVAGDITVSGGAVELSSAGQIIDTSAVTLDSGTFNLSSFPETIKSLTFNGGTLLGTAILSLNNVGGAALTMRNTTLSGPVSILGGSVVFDNANNGTATIASPFDLGTVIRTFDIANGAAASDMEISGVISGLGGITKTGAGTLKLSGINTYTGGTSIAAGTLGITTDSNLGTGSLTLTTGGMLAPSAATTITRTIVLNGSGIINTTAGSTILSGAIIGGGSLTKTGVNTLILSGANTYSGGTTVISGILQGTTTSLQGAVTNNASVVFDQTTTGTYSGTMSGLGVLTKQNTGTLILSGANTYSGGTTVSSGILQGTATSLQGSVTNNASVVFDQTTTGTYAGTMSGPGVLTKQNTGTLILSGANTYSGGTTVSSGILQGTATSLQGAVTNNASVVFDQATTGTYSGTMSGSGVLEKQNTGTLILSGANNYRGGTTVNSGILQGTTTSLQGMITNNASVVFDQTTTGTYAGAMSGSGSLTKQNTGTLILSGANSYSGGTTIISAGTLRVDGSLTSQGLAVNPGAFLRGTGSVTTVNNSGTVFPGSSIGTLQINGDYTQASNGMLFIELDENGNSDLLQITGTANLAGTIKLDPLPGLYQAGTSYTVLTAGTVNGTFDQLQETHPFDFFVSYPSNSVLVNISFSGAVLPISIDELKGNARKIADYLFCSNFLPPNQDLLDVMRHLIRLPAKDFAKELIQLGPQQFKALALTGMQNNTRSADAVVKRLNSYDHYWGLQCDSHQESSSRKDAILTNAYLENIGYYYKQSERQDQFGFDVRTYGYNTGVEIALPSHLTCLVDIGYLYSNLHWKEQAGCAELNSISFGSSVGYITKRWYVDFVAIGSRTFYSVDRQIQFPGVNRNAHNHHKSWDVLAGMTAGVKLKAPNNFQSNLFLLPSYRLYYLNIFEGGYREQGANSINLSVRNKRSSFLKSQCDAKIIKELHFKKACLSPAIQIGWVQYIPLSDEDYTSRFYKQQTCKSKFTVEALDKSRNQLVLGAQFTISNHNHLSFQLAYEANIGADYQVQEVTMRVQWEF